MGVSRIWRLRLLACALAVASGQGARAEPPDTGVAAHRPVIAAACPTCVWGPLAEIVAAALKPAGYQVQICYNCNLDDSPRYVAYARMPPPLTAHNIELGDPPPPHGPVDFGITEVHFLEWLYQGTHQYAKDGPQHQLRLLARIEDPNYLLVAVKADSGITGLEQLAGRRGLKVMSEDDPWVHPVLERYHLTRPEVEARGGAFANPMAQVKAGDFDVIVSGLGSLANNRESDVWYEMTTRFRLRFLPVAPDLLARIARELDGDLVNVPVGYLRGVDRPIATVGRSGHAIFARADLPEPFAYLVARQIDERQDLLKWSIRPFSYNPHTVWKAGPVPLHPGAARYYREVGYLR
ncbi:MAG TPA: TAXI family TRAP transporter solute-binding subunit [Steroidobacteraceae bacterium]|nr:TAXI family TRAP transporter solute-binding subunit [Steroidobacteraceae bacterium]